VIGPDGHTEAQHASGACMSEGWELSGRHSKGYQALATTHQKGKPKGLSFVCVVSPLESDRIIGISLAFVANPPLP